MPMPTQPAILKELAPGLTITEVAERSGLSLSHVSNILHRRRTGTLDALKKLAAGLGLSLPRLLEALGHGDGARAQARRRKLSS